MKPTIRFLAEDGCTLMRLVDPHERLSLLASEQAEKVMRGDGTTDGTIKLKKYAPEESYMVLPAGRESPTGLNARDMERNAMGCVDTPKKREIYRLRKKALERGEEKPVPAGIRCYGHDRRDKPNEELVGNSIDRSMTRVEHWPHASNTNRSVTVTPAGVVGLREVAREDLAKLEPLAL